MQPLWTPAPPLPPDEWADAKRVLPKGSPEPGKFRSSRAPWMIRFGREAVSGRRRRCVGVMGSQTGKTDGLLNISGQKIETDPGPILYVGPTKSNIEKVIEPRFMRMVRGAPSLHAQLDRGKPSKTLKVFGDVSLRFGWAGSPTELASQDAAMTQTDELDRMKGNVGGEGSPLELIEGRLEAHTDGVSIVTSTPTEGSVETYVDEFGIERWKVAPVADVASPIWRLWQEGTRHEWAWPCPDCGEYFVPRSKLLQWPKSATPQQAEEQARLVCPHCGVMIETSAKDAMNARGVAVAPGEQVHPDGTITGQCAPNRIFSLWVSGLCSSWRSFGDRAQRLLSAQLSGDEQRVRAVLNTRFGELYSVGGKDAPQSSSVRACAAGYVFGEVPPGVRWVTCFVDVQKRSLVYAIRGWGAGMESWLLEAGEIPGETERDEPWQQLALFQDREFGERRLRIHRLGIDSGYRPGEKWRRPDNQIYAFGRQYGRWVCVSKSWQQRQRPISMSHIDVTIRGKTFAAGLRLWHLDSDVFKSWVHSQIAADDAGKERRWHVPGDVSEEYCQQLTAESRMLNASGRATWVRLRKANHFLDCEAGNVAMAQIMGLHRRRRRSIGQQPAPSEQPPEQADEKPSAPAPDQTKPQRAARPPRMRRNWARNW